MTPCLSQSRSYLKIIGIPYIIEDTNVPINFSIIKAIIKSTHIFNDVCLALKPCIIKVLPKSDIAVIWVDIWDAQSSIKAKGLIKRCFNVSNYITTICRINMSLEVS